MVGKALEKISKKKEIFISENDENFSDKSRNEISINFTLYDSEKIECENLHGTGCLFSSLVAIYMSMNRNIKNVFPMVCQYMERAISQSCNYRLGNSCYGPVNINEYAF